MDELVTWLRAQLDEDERVAIAASPNTWKPDGWTNANGVEYLVVADYASTPPAFAIQGEANAEHIARWDPARVLAEVEAKRRILGWCVEVIGSRDLSRYGEAGSLRDDRDSLAVTLAVETIRLMMLPYADRPGYRPEWQPWP